MQQAGKDGHGNQEREYFDLMQQMLRQERAEAPREDDPAARRHAFEYWESSFGDKVRQWRKARNWSQEDLANLLRDRGFDMHQTTVAKIERGTRPLRVAEAAAIADTFNVPPLAVFVGGPLEKQPWSMRQMQEELELAQQSLAITKDLMETMANQYIEQQASVVAIANRLNEAALRAEVSAVGNEDSKPPEGNEIGNAKA